MNTQTVEYEPASSPTLTLYQRALLGLLGLLALAGGALAVTAWRAAEELAAREATRQSDLRDFHAQLVSEVRGLAETSGMLTSSDLCPVRFRFRLTDLQSPPGRPVHVSLQSGDNDWQPVHIGTNTAGITEFGLVRPGEYRMTARMDDGYSLEHEFAVLPGVPVDRLVLCPYLSHDGLHTALQVEWPESLRDCRLRAACEVERDDVRAGEWTWAPRDRGRLLVMSPAADEAMRDHDDLAGPFQQTGELDIDLVTSIPHRYCRISRIRVWHAGSDADPPTELATFAYCAGEGAVGTRPSDVALAAPCPRHERSVRTDEWVVTLPPEAEAALRRSLAIDADASNAPPPPFRGGHGPASSGDASLPMLTTTRAYPAPLNRSELKLAGRSDRPISGPSSSCAVAGLRTESAQCNSSGRGGPAAWQRPSRPCVCPPRAPRVCAELSCNALEFGGKTAGPAESPISCE